MLLSIVQLINRHTLNLTPNFRKLATQSIFTKNAKEIIHNNRACITTCTFLRSSFKDKLYTQNDLQEFRTFFPTIIKELTGAEKNDDLSELKAEFNKLMNYVLPKSDFSQGLTTVVAYKMLENENKLIPENIKLANIMGWILEMNENYVLLIEDIVHQSKKRRGAPTWHMIAKKDLSTVYDGCYLQGASYALLKSHFAKHPCYLSLLHLFQDVEIKNTTGHAIDDLATKNGNINFDVFEMNIYDSLATLRNGYLNFYFPVASAMYMANIDDQELHEEAKTILLEVGKFYRMAEDYKDYFGNTKNQGNDKRTGKLSWLAVSAMTKSTSAQRKIMEAHYGKSGEEAHNAIRDLYKELGLKKDFYELKRKRFDKINDQIQNLPEKLPRDLFIKIAEGVFKQNF